MHTEYSIFELCPKKYISKMCIDLSIVCTAKLAIRRAYRIQLQMPKGPHSKRQ